MMWTTEQPTVPGLYWFRRYAGDTAEIVELRDGGGLTFVYEMGHDDGVQLTDWPAGEWYGPLEAPK